MTPMCAFKFQQYGHLLKPPFYVQPKLNGVRALFSASIWQSRDEHLWKAPVLAHLTAQLSKTCPPHYILDGELYVHGWSLQQINSAISINRNEPSSKTPQVEFHVFDIIDSTQLNESFELRYGSFSDLSDRLDYGQASHIKLVETTQCFNHGTAELLYPFYRQSGYEGTMYRDASAPYGFSENCTNKENRWKCLLKRKDWLDAEFEIIGFNETTGEKGEAGFQLWCKAENGKQFAVGSGLSHIEREGYASGTLESLAGKQAKIKYETLSDEGIPLKPTILAILD